MYSNLRRKLLASLLAGGAALALHASTAGAVLVPQDGGPGSTGSAPTGTTPPVSTCTTDPPATWPQPPRVVIHTKGLKDLGVSDARLDELLEQANDAAAQIGKIGASLAQVGSVTETTASNYAYRSKSFADTVPTIHVGFVSHATITADHNGKDAEGLTTEHPYMSDNCIPVATMDLAADSSTEWSFSTPFDLGVNYWSASANASGTTEPGIWFRPSFLHELMHAFGLTHTKTAYAMMNHRGSGFPWGNRADADAVRPLPDDVRRLRDSYPASGSYWDVDVTNGWDEYTDASKGDAADQVKVCTPSVGTSVVTDAAASGPCGTGGPRAGSSCARPRDTLATRYTLNNYSTGTIHVTSTLAFSDDPTWEAPDPESSTKRTEDVAAESSKLVSATWTVPDTSGAKLYPIVHVFSEHLDADGSIDPASLRIYEYPLSGTVKVDANCAS